MSVQSGAIEDLRASVGLQIADEQLLRTLAAGLTDVEKLLRVTARSEVKAVHDAARIIAETFPELVPGEMRETAGPVDGEDPVEHYLSVIGQKTGSLIATAGRFGGMVSDAEPEHVEALCRFGDIIGAAFQISDD